MLDQLLTVEQVIDYLQISKRTLFRMLQQGKLRALKVGNSYRFNKLEIEEDLKINKHEVATR